MRIRVLAALGLAVSIVPAAADSRDIARAHMARCESIQQTRQYLDCLYGALQPLRADLSLPAAPQAQTYAPLFAQPGGAYVASAVPGPPVPTTRYVIAQPEKENNSFMSSMLGRQTRLVAPEQFGLKNARPGPGVNVDHLVEQVRDFNIAARGFTITLINGQVWQQLASDDSTPHWTRGQKLVATLSYGAYDTFNLSVGDRVLYKVRRVK